MNIKFLGLTALLLAASSCSSDFEEVYTDQMNSESVSQESDAEAHKLALKEQFACILSKATFHEKEVRELLKSEALKQFDKNYDVLYHKIKNTKAGDSTLREILKKYSSATELSVIEQELPLLNILVPDMSIFDLRVEDLDCNDSEIPVALDNGNGMALYLDGEKVEEIPYGELPDFHTFVVNDNSCVKVTRSTRGEECDYDYEFISPDFDGTKVDSKGTRSADVESSYLNSKEIQAFNYFNSPQTGRNATYLQRDYLYYGMTPSSEKGQFNHNVSEYLRFIEVDPKSYYTIADQQVGEAYDDAIIEHEKISHKKTDLTEEELITRMWSEGEYRFRFDVFVANDTRPITKYVAKKPAEIWNFNYEKSYRHSTAFRHSKYTYKINPDNFTAKRVNLLPDKIALGKWDLSTEALSRYVSIYEEDKSGVVTKEMTQTVTKTTSSKVNGNIKFGLGSDFTLTSGFDSSKSSTTTKTVKYTFQIQEKDDPLGSVLIYFYEPLIESKNGSNYILREYNTGYIKFGVAVY